ncbi:MAG: tetratricopeptide repeat protein [Roseofilum sp. SBFL]|nr:tetratricopeptide repeat protein [Roseofilum sp. SID3]MBP0022680.1 tetratricopeptide repeat protein [Roseofilum sp. SID2]MBP0039240.1 tetratricopeptide repeat protein [Roseofilum sp. SID1]MBP0042678.1 tetratricopeptide repeat protein [Roseofilum sp. SBFL]
MLSEACVVPKPIYYALLVCLWSGWGGLQPAWGQAIVPHTLQLEREELEEEGIKLARQAEQLAKFQQYEPALPRAQLAVQLLPDDIRAWFLLGRLYVQTDDVERGIETLEKARSLEPKNELVLFTLGSAHFQNEDYQRAADYLQEGLRIKPDQLAALFDLGNAYYKLNRWSDAIAQYEKAVRQDEEFWEGINNIGLIEYEQGEVDGAIASWRKAVSIEPNAAEPQLALAVALYMKGDREQGLRMGAAALELDPAYADLEFLEAHLWGDRLLADTKTFLETPRIQETLAQLSEAEFQHQH